MTRPDRPLISVVFSFRNEAENDPTLVARLDAMFAARTSTTRSCSSTTPRLTRRCRCCCAERQRNPRVKVVNMSRRFGVAEGVLAGMATSQRRRRGLHGCRPAGSAGSDPGSARSLAGRRRRGPHDTHAAPRRESAQDVGDTPRPTALIQFGSSIELPVDAGDFKLLSRAASCDTCCACASRIPILRGLVVWLGFNQAFVPYERGLATRGTHAFPVLQPRPVEDVHRSGFSSFSFLPIYTLRRIAAARRDRSRDRLVLASPDRRRTPARHHRRGRRLGHDVGAIAAVGLSAPIYNDVRRRPLYIDQSAIGCRAAAPELNR